MCFVVFGEIHPAMWRKTPNMCNKAVLLTKQLLFHHSESRKQGRTTCPTARERLAFCKYLSGNPVENSGFQLDPLWSLAVVLPEFSILLAPCFSPAGPPVTPAVNLQHPLALIVPCSSHRPRSHG